MTALLEFTRFIFDAFSSEGVSGQKEADSLRRKSEIRKLK